MPHFTLNIGPAGPVMDVAIGVSRPRFDALQQAGQTAPPPIVIRGLIDTGASGTCVDPSVLISLGLSPTGIVPVLTPTTGNTPVNAEQYDVSVTLLGAINWSFGSLAVMRSELEVQGIQALIGRDVLSHCMLVYNGSANLFTLAF